MSRKPVESDLAPSKAESGPSGPLAHAKGLDPELVVEADTELGPLWVEKSGTILTPWLVSEGYWDPALTALVRRALEPGRIFVDVGANIGYFTVLASRLVGPRGRVYAIEPEPTNISILEANLWRHGCSNVTVLPVAAWSERTHLKITRPPEEGATALVGGSEGGGSLVPAARLDDLISEPVDYIKIDCEWTDHIVVRGAEGLIQENPSTLLTVEFVPGEAGHTGVSPSQILDQYRGMGLTPYEISQSGNGVRPTTYSRVANPVLPEGHLSFDFALSMDLPDRLMARGLAKKGLLERAGDMLEHVPERVRPRIRHRDRAAPKRSS
jgi:FkbM family methyltransferase